MRVALIYCLLLASTTCMGADRNATIRQLMEAQGLLVMLQDQIDSGRKQGEMQARQMLDQMIEGLKGATEYRARARKATEEFISALSDPWTAEDIVDQWAKVYAPEFSDSELEQLLAYYTSPLGKKDVAATQKALPLWMAQFYERFKPIQERATQKYIDDLNQISSAAKGRK